MLLFVLRALVPPLVGVTHIADTSISLDKDNAFSISSGWYSLTRHLGFIQARIYLMSYSRGSLVSLCAFVRVFVCVCMHHNLEMHSCLCVPALLPNGFEVRLGQRLN